MIHSITFAVAKKMPTITIFTDIENLSTFQTNLMLARAMMSPEIQAYMQTADPDETVNIRIVYSKRRDSIPVKSMVAHAA